jgi:hypothetical protein
MDDPGQWCAKRLSLSLAEEEDASFLLLLAALDHDKGIASIPWQTLQYRAMSMEQRKRRRRAIPRPSLLLPCNSAWEQLYGAGCDQNLITFTGFDHRAFRKLHQLFQPL